jgi:hypothetical protein
MGANNLAKVLRPVKWENLHTRGIPSGIDQESQHLFGKNIKNFIE